MVVRTDRGERLGWVVVAPDQVLSATVEGPLRVVDRIASEADVDAWRERRRQAQEDIGRAQALATRSDPRLRVASISYDLAGRFAELTYTAGDRVEHDWFARQFGELLEIDELALEQVGDRDRAKALGGIGQCGRGLCCATWMTNFPQISIKMAKDQDLSPNPSKISGVCGRLLCCLSFEVEAYRELRGDLPRVGRRVTTPVGRAKVLSVNTLKQLVRLRFDETGEVVEMGADELRAQYGTAVRPEELESVVEEPRRQKERRIRDTFNIITKS
ncbi:MAG: regulatory iron-sulfur-containing complex subunit RicT [Chloroflexi bacterium]|nr:regulatory iron-sulfur-containing complex subunit RicT [Chloroflexota bacterium]